MLSKIISKKKIYEGENKNKNKNNNVNIQQINFEDIMYKIQTPKTVDNYNNYNSNNTNYNANYNNIINYNHKKNYSSISYQNYYKVNNNNNRRQNISKKIGNKVISRLIIPINQKFQIPINNVCQSTLSCRKNEKENSNYSMKNDIPILREYKHHLNISNINNKDNHIKLLDKYLLSNNITKKK